MGFTSSKGLWSEMSGRGAGSNMVMWSVAVVVSLGALGCGVEPLAEETRELTTRSQEQREDNGLSLNGLSLNGLSLNGLSLNGLSLNGLESPQFIAWFSANPLGHDTLMKYMVRCAVPAGETRTYKAPDKRVYSWDGGLGLAPNWSLGGEASLEERQVISACLAAHVNNYGLHVPISVLGRNAKGTAIPYTPAELQAYSQTEACFFGDLFAPNPRLFAGNDRFELDDTLSTSRPCGLSGPGSQSHEKCQEIQRVGSCSASCTLDPTGTFYTSCTQNGTVYLPLTTRISTDSMYSCGDGVCQVSERAGPGFTTNSCSLDCGSP